MSSHRSRCRASDLLPSLGFGECVGNFNSSQEADSRVKFYDKYHKVAEEYDKVFMKKHEEDLNTTLIFVFSSGIRGISVDGIRRPVCSLL